LSLQPLSQQLVSLTDSRLGVFSSQHLAPGTPGLKITYQRLIQQAFQPVWWDSPNDICVLPGSPPVEIILGTKKSQLSCPSGWLRYTQAEYNFSLFWGLSIQMYESMLRSDQSRVDKFLLKADQTISTIVAATGDGSTRVFNFTIPAPVLSSTIFITT